MTHEEIQLMLDGMGEYLNSELSDEQLEQRHEARNAKDKEKTIAHYKKLGKECVESGRQRSMSVKGGKTVTEAKLESIRKRAKEQRQYSDEQILEMKELYSNDISIDFDYLATKYGCSVSQISLIMNGKQYVDVGEPVKIRPALFKCPHCDKPPMIKSNLTRFHGDKCKMKS